MIYGTSDDPLLLFFTICPLKGLLVLLDLIVYIVQVAIDLLLVEIVFQAILRPDLKGVDGDGPAIDQLHVPEHGHKIAKGLLEGPGVLLSEIGDLSRRWP